MVTRDLVLPSLGCTTSEQKAKTESSTAMRGRLPRLPAWSSLFGKRKRLSLSLSLSLSAESALLPSDNRAAKITTQRGNATVSLSLSLSLQFTYFIPQQEQVHCTVSVRNLLGIE